MSISRYRRHASAPQPDDCMQIVPPESQDRIDAVKEQLIDVEEKQPAFSKI
jgi:hypothetical protein